MVWAIVRIFHEDELPQPQFWGELGSNGDLGMVVSAVGGFLG